MFGKRVRYPRTPGRDTIIFYNLPTSDTIYTKSLGTPFNFLLRFWGPKMKGDMVSVSKL